MIILLGGNKGSAKSTLTLNLATYFADKICNVEVIDADPQKSITKWFIQRNTVYPDNIKFNVIYQTGNINKFIVERQATCELIIVDVAGYNSIELSSAMMVADLLITPFETSQFSLDTLDETIIQKENIDKINPDLIIRSLQTRATTIHNIINTDRQIFIEYCSAYGITPFDTIIFERRIWKNVSSGRSLFDFNSKAALKAQDEIINLSNEILGIFNVDTK